jgi:hypothetical protein
MPVLTPFHETLKENTRATFMGALAPSGLEITHSPTPHELSAHINLSKLTANASVHSVS